MNICYILHILYITNNPYKICSSKQNKETIQTINLNFRTPKEMLENETLFQKSKNTLTEEQQISPYRGPMF